MNLSYEGFRNTLPGWLLVAVFVFVTLPYLDLSGLSSSETFAAILLGILSSQVVGYLISQAVRTWQDWRHSRPNENDLIIVELAKTSYDLAEQHRISQLRAVVERLVPGIETSECSVPQVGAKDLHRYLWVVLANGDLRARSESYWERHNTNQNLMATIILGGTIGFAASVSWEIQRSLAVDAWMLFTFTALGKAIVLAIIWFVLRRANRSYARIARGIENAWIDGFLVQIREEPRSVSLL